MTQQSNLGASLSEAEFNNLCSHYKDTYEIHLASIKQRDTLFYALLLILALFSLQVTSTDLVNSALSSYVNKQLDLSIDKNSNLFGTLLWLLLFGFSSKYYQSVIQIERQYGYIHHLEEIVSSRYSGTRAFTREGKSYLGEYPLFSNWVWFLYTIAFPLIILLCIVIRIYGDLANYESLGVSLIPAYVSYLLVGTSTVLFIGKLHGSSLSRCIRRVSLPLKSRIGGQKRNFMSQASNESQAIENYLLFSNDILGILALSLGASCLGFKHPQPFAWFFLFVLTLWLLSKQIPLTLNHFNKYKTLKDNFRLIWELKIFLIGYVFLGSIGFGVTTQENVYALLGYGS